ncbi:T9SS type A sorting domain-containing protein, partial [Flavobacterium sp. LB3P122]|uniref:T9SS type A sorting domain-containing protein n=1 Tax=Flavobacterium algoriphilum TaxID=3398738 RepID=UPI003A858D1F
TLGCNPTADAINAALGTATATDTCGAVTPTFTDATVVITGCLRSQTRTWNVTDACGNAAIPVSRTTTWTVDLVAPIIIALPVVSTINCPVLPAFAQATATDNCAVASLTFADVTTPGNCPGNYSLTRTWTATDDCGNHSSASQTINVHDNTAPVIECPANKVINSGDIPSAECVDLGGGGVATVDDKTSNGPPLQNDKVDFSQPRNQDHPEIPLDWTNGINNATQAEYFEGMGVPQRIIFTQLKGNTHTFRFRHEAVKHQSGDRHAYDFLMSWEQAIATAATIGNGAVNELQNLMAQTCNEGISATAGNACENFTTSAWATVTDNMGNPPNHHGNNSVNNAISCFESTYGNRQIEIEGNSPITNFNIVFDGYSGRADGDNYAWYTVTWKSTSDAVMIKMAGRAAVGEGSCGYGSCYGAGSINGGPYHFKLEQLDNHSLGNRDNQVMVEKPCIVDIPVTFDTPTVSDSCDPNPVLEVINSDVVTVNPDGSITHCRTWEATDDCANSSKCSQCITIVCDDTKGSKDPKTSNITNETAGFTAYPVPFKDILTIRYDFDYASDVKIEVFDAQGISVLSKTDTNSYLNKEITLHLHSYKGQEQVYIVKVTTDRGSSVKKVMTSK